MCPSFATLAVRMWSNRHRFTLFEGTFGRDSLADAEFGEDHAKQVVGRGGAGNFTQRLVCEPQLFGEHLSGALFRQRLATRGKVIARAPHGIGVSPPRGDRLFTEVTVARKSTYLYS